MTKKLLLAVALVILLGLIVLGVGVLGSALLGGRGSEAPWPAVVPEENGPAYGLPLKITVKDVPEVPKEILGPSPPIEEKKEDGE